MAIEKNEPVIAFTTLQRGMSREEMKHRLIQAMLNKGITVKGYDVSVKLNTDDDTKRKGSC